MLVFSMCVTAMPLPAGAANQPQAAPRADTGPVLPLPASGESLFAFLDRLLANLPLLSKLMEGLGYIRPK
ncbi:hypothetical protein H4S06_000852 [Coemansia sp. BCRC 34490]|nr:hypothetical protein H4S06_000852 [Coemansia sp. BCRC 34490]